MRFLLLLSGIFPLLLHSRCARRAAYAMARCDTNFFSPFSFWMKFPLSFVDPTTKDKEERFHQHGRLFPRRGRLGTMGNLCCRQDLYTSDNGGTDGSSTFIDISNTRSLRRHSVCVTCNCPMTTRVAAYGWYISIVDDVDRPKAV